MGNKITYDMLVRAGACDARYDFADYFGTEVEVTREIVFEYRAKLDVGFIVEHFFPEDVREKYHADKRKIVFEHTTETRNINEMYGIKDYQCSCGDCHSESKYKTDADLVAARHAKYKKLEALREATNEKKAALFADTYNSLPADIHESDPLV